MIYFRQSWGHPHSPLLTVGDSLLKRRSCSCLKALLQSEITNFFLQLVFKFLKGDMLGLCPLIAFFVPCNDRSKLSNSPFTIFQPKFLFSCFLRTLCASPIHLHFNHKEKNINCMCLDHSAEDDVWV
jgi:hypothetical protein